MRTLLIAAAALLFLLPLSQARSEEMSATLVPQSPLAETPLPENPLPPAPLSETGTQEELLPGSTLPQSPLPATGPPHSNYPKIVLFSVSWCPHCKAAKEYLTRNNIPFINRDIEIDPDAYQLLTRKYNSQGVPVIVIGDDAEVIRGFDEEKFQKVLEKYKK